MFKQLFFLLAALLFAFSSNAEQKTPEVKKPETLLANLHIQLAEENAFQLEAEIETFGPAKIKLLAGGVSLTYSKITSDSGSFWVKNPEAVISFDKQAYYLNCPAKGKYKIKLDFISKVNKNALMRDCFFYLLPALVRQVNLTLSPQNTEPEITGCISLRKSIHPVGIKSDCARYSGTLQGSGDFSMKWKRLVDSKAAALAVNAEVYSVGSVLTGAVKINTRIAYKIFQGSLKKLSLRIPENLNVLAIKGENILDWQINKKDQRQIIVELTEKQYKNYSLEIQAEQILSKTPCTFTLRPVIPENVMRLDGSLRFGAGRGVKLLVDKTDGLVQIDNDSFYKKQLPEHTFTLLNPLSYNFSSNDYRLTAKVENIRPSYSANMNCIANCTDRSLDVRLDCELDIKDAPLHEITIDYEPSLTFSRVIGRQINPQDYDLENEKNFKKVKISFRKEVFGKVSFSIYFERELKEDKYFSVPNFKIENAKSVRGYLLLSADRGLRLLPENLKNLTPVHPGSLPLRQARLQYSYLFRTSEWNGKVNIEHVKGNIISEIFNLVSAGEGTAYGSSIISFHISGAPVDNLRFTVGDDMKNLEFKGTSIISRKKISSDKKGFSIWEVKLRKKRLGDITILATYEISIKDGGTLRLGAISALDSDFSSSFIALAGVKSLKVTSAESAPSVQEIDQSELPEEYLQMINNPLLKVYRGAGQKQWQDVKISRYSKCAMPQTVIDRTELSTRFDANGGSVTTVQYRIKNSTGQFLSLKLPEKSDLWKVKVNDRSKRLSVSDGRLLIPLPRHRNINMPIAIEVVYAQKFNNIDNKSKISLTAPQSEIKSLFCSWLVSVPDNCAIISSNPEPVKRREAFAEGFAGLIERLSFYAGTRTGTAFIIGWILTTFIGCAFFWCCAKKQMFAAVLAFIVGSVTVFVSIVAMAESFSRNHLGPLHSFVVNQATFTRVMGLDGKAFSLDIVIKNMEVATMWSSMYTLISIAAAIILFIAAKFITPRFLKAICIGAGCTLIVFAISQWFRMSIYAGLILAFAIPIALSFALWLATWRKFKIAAAVIVSFMMLSTFTAEASKVSIVENNDIIIENLTCIGGMDNYRIPSDESIDTGINVKYEFIINAEKPGKIDLFSYPIILASLPASNSQWNIVRDGEKYVLEIKEKGRFKLSLNIEAPIIRRNGKQTFTLPVNNCIKNNFILWESQEMSPEAPKPKLKIKALNAISEKYGRKSLQAVFVPGGNAEFELSERAQKAEGEDFTFFAKTTSYVKIGRGSTEISNSVSLNIPQGALKVINFEVPSNIRVTSVQAGELEAWRFDRNSKTLKVFFSKAQRDSCSLTINCQIPDGKLPRSVSIAPLKLVEAVKQYGSYGIFVSQEVKINESENKSFTPVNNSLFANAEMANALLKKTFRYSSTDSLLTLKVTEVKPELRVSEKAEVNFEDERITLNSELMLNIIKGGIFSVRLQLPEGFEINRLTGNNIQHWDEVKADGKSQVIINFIKRLNGKNAFNISLSKMTSENYKKAAIPAIRVIDARKHTGDLSVNVEKGTTISIVKRNGITVSNEKTRFVNNSTNFKILRPDWSLEVAFAVTPPWIQVKTLQNINIKAHNIECNTFLNYSIENAGIKRFKVTLPPNCAAPEFSGRYIRSAGKLEGNTWGIELDRKVEHSYRLKVRCQLKLNKDNSLSITPFISPESGIQTGYATLFAEDSLQLKKLSAKGELTSFNSRNVPAIFGTRNLSDAILCYRTVGKDYNVQIGIIRHQNASTLKASVDSVTIKSLIAESGQVISKATLSVSNNNQTFLPLKLPEGCILWAAFVDSAPVEAVQNGDMSLIPLEQDTSTGDCIQNVEFIYSSSSSAKWTPYDQDYNGPLFGLPLKNIQWEVFLPENREYSKFGGTLKYRNELFSALDMRTISDYDVAVRKRVQSEAGKAKKLFTLGRSYIQKGDNKKAFATLNEANSFTGDKSLQSDIQGQQLINSRLQNVYNISKRRNSIAQSTSVSEPQKQQLQQKSNDMQALRQQMGDEELKNLQSISDKIFMQQQAATSTPRLFDITIPWKGKKITFERALEIRKDAPLEINFKSAQKLKINRLSSPLLFAGLILVFSIIAALTLKKKEA